MSTPSDSTGPEPDPTPASEVVETPDDRTLATLAHLLGIFTSFIGALVIWLVKRESSPFVDDQGKEALNFQITIILAQMVAGVLVAVGVGCVLLPAVLVANIVFCILAAVAASNGQQYRYPVTLRLIS